MSVFRFQYGLHLAIKGEEYVVAELLEDGFCNPSSSHSPRYHSGRDADRGHAVPRSASRIRQRG
jgi:hypothetical protein